METRTKILEAVIEPATSEPGQRWTVMVNHADKSRFWAIVQYCFMCLTPDSTAYIVVDGYGELWKHRDKWLDQNDEVTLLDVHRAGVLRRSLLLGSATEKYAVSLPIKDLVDFIEEIESFGGYVTHVSNFYSRTSPYDPARDVGGKDAMQFVVLERTCDVTFDVWSHVRNDDIMTIIQNTASQFGLSIDVSRKDKA